ncbi:MAG: DinB family protein [Spirosomataceae bacterium]
MNQVKKLISEVLASRNRFLDTVSKCSEQQAQWKPVAEVWSIVEITEHLFWAEHGGILGMWRVLQAKREGNYKWEGELIHQGLSVEEIVEKTWQPKETVPPIAAPRLGGPIGFWAASLESLQVQLDALGDELTDMPLDSLIHPHPISGPIDIKQRLEFLRFSY